MKLRILLSIVSVTTASPVFHDQQPFLQELDTGTDLDSMTSALSWAYHLTHLPVPQTEEDALDLRPENKLALHYAKMASKHRDLLTIDELPIRPFDLYHRIKGIALVDHNIPRSYWSNSTILSIIDHHDDRGLAPHASPRIIETSASCASLVTRTIFDEMDRNGEMGHVHGPLPTEMVEMLLRAIAIDSSGLKKGGGKMDVDVESTKRLLTLSSWRGRKAREVMKLLNDDLSQSKKSLESLDLRDLLRRDWKGDAIPTKSKKYPTLTLGIASIPLSINQQIDRTPEQTAPEWFAVERAFTSEVGADISIVLTNSKDKDGNKVREIALIVAHGLGSRLHEGSSNRLFDQLKDAIKNSKELEGLEKWERPDGHKLLPRRAVWKHYGDAGRKQIRPIVEQVVREWTG
ncbi:exopolyphosphatase [Pseudohyphozyma bogoriensis]|nr:exopolyphosphatase [Pseudohyphozyma bogoriensis]